MRLPNRAHTQENWRIHGMTTDFVVEDVWAFHTPGAGPNDFPRMLEAMRATPPQRSVIVGFLFALRWKLGARFGWDRRSAGLGTRVASLRDRLPDDLRDAPVGAESPYLPLRPVYELKREAVREIANATVHAVMHLGWVERADHEYELRMAVLVKPNGPLGRLYLTAITPFRYLLVYPTLTRQWERAWLQSGMRDGARS
jgi:hypothetical protein